MSDSEPKDLYEKRILVNEHGDHEVIYVFVSAAVHGLEARLRKTTYLEAKGRGEASVAVFVPKGTKVVEY